MSELVYVGTCTLYTCTCMYTLYVYVLCVCLLSSTRFAEAVSTFTGNAQSGLDQCD